MGLDQRVADRTPQGTAVDEFTRFAREAERRLRPALVAMYGAERGLDAAEDALVYAWRHWDRVSGLDNPFGYLFRVGQRAAKRPRPRPLPLLHDPPSMDRHPFEPGLEPALKHLSPMQRAVAVLVEGYGYSQREAGELLGIRPSSVQKHLERGLRKLRRELGVASDD